MAQWNPLNDLVSLQDRMNRLFEDATQRRAQDNATDEVEGADWYPAADVYENDKSYIVAVDLPGIDRSTLDISVDDDTLAIRGQKADLEARQHRAERPRGKFLRTFSVPASVDQKGIKADYRDGVLQVHLPKRAERKAQRVEIKVL
ncbi:MAG TPA: Hsp20/alpha crystallin family protein [Pyrinomonadaceae bacterium]|nr:Hsp20/alpha crystallin family protein [Pyrinomonadaceae bacterium]